MKRAFPALLLCLALMGCSNVKYQSHPGAVNVFASQSYDTLVSADAVIKQTKLDLANNTFPASWVPNVKTALNAVITAYNVADVSWQAYNSDATSTTQATLQANVNSLNSSLTSLSTAKGGGQ